MQVKRAPASDVERAAVEIAAVMASAALRRERMSSPPSRFPLHPVRFRRPQQNVLSQDVDSVCSQVVGIPRRPPPAPPTVPVQTDEDCTPVAPLPRMRGVLESLERANAAALPLDPVNTAPLELPFKEGLEPTWVAPQQWGSAMQLTGLSPEALADVYKLLRKELVTGALVVVRRAEEVRLVSPVFVVYRVDGKARLVHDLRALNSRLKTAPTKYEDIRHALIHTRAFATKLDLACAFKHMAVSQAASSMMTFQIGETTFRWTRLPFGMTHSPRMFVAALAPTIERLRARGIALSVYVDDILISARSVTDLDSASVELLNQLARDGWRVAPEKCYPWAHSGIVFLGLRLELDGRKPRATVPPSKARKLAGLAQSALAKQRVTLHELQRITGLMAFFLIAVPTIGLFWRALQGAVAEAERLPGRHVWVRGLLKTELELWSTEATALPGWPNPLAMDGGVEWQVATDASEDGAGAVWWPPGTVAPSLDDWVRNRMAIGHGCTMAALRLPADCLGTPSAVRELVGLELAITSMFPLPAAAAAVPAGPRPAIALHGNFAATGKIIRLRWFCDSTAAVAGLTNWRSGSDHCTLILQRIARLCCLHGIVVSPVWISRSFGWIPAADYLSREIGRRAQAEWSLQVPEFERICQVLHARPCIDLFASRRSAMLPRYRSQFPEPGSEGDAFAGPWPPGHVYAFPPFSQLDRALQHWRLCSARSVLLLVAPADSAALVEARRLGEVKQVTRLVCQRLVDCRGQAAPQDIRRPLAAFLLRAPPRR